MWTSARGRASRAHKLKDPNIVTKFSELGLAAPLLKALDAEGYAAPTPIQAKAIPPVLAGRDLLGIAQTGTGKTAAFALPILHRLAADPKPAPRKACRTLVLTPTRELATQIGESFRTYGRLLGLKVAVVFGGVAHSPQIKALANGVDVLVATPGRLLDHVGERNVSLQSTEILVLDEADQMLDLGFVKPIRRIVQHLSHKRQSLFFSATMPREIGHLADELLRDPVKVAVTPAATTVEKVAQRVIHIETHKKRALLAELFADAQITRALVFTRTKRGADRVAKHLEAAGVSVAAIHGNKSQKQRELALDAFRQARIRALVATDIAARGIDIDRVSHVVNYELPDVPESYVHRIGRTARAGAAGIAISLCDAEERAQLRDIERLTRQTIAAEDRRNDASLVAEGRVSGRPRRHASGHSDGGQRHGARDRHRAGGERRHAEHRDSHRGGHDHAEAASSRGHDGRNQHRGQRNGKANGHQHSARTPASASTGPSGMERVAFMARPSQARPIGRAPDRDKGHRAASRPVRY
jgi:ATP-dependent RNA helicase RhlE